MIVAVAIGVLAFGNSKAFAQGAGAAAPAQGGAPPPEGTKFSGADGAGPALTLAQATISPAMAKRTMFPNIINAKTAQALVNACADWVAANPRAVTMDIIVMSPTGQTVSSLALDGLMPIGEEATVEKAKTVLFTRQRTSQLEAANMKSKDGLISRRDFGKSQGLAYFDVAGGFPLIVEGQLIGVMAVGGGAGGAMTPDSLCAFTAMKKVLGPQPDLILPGTH
jgi:uncharacterized protein GlcG (DUF336 family)